MSDASCTTWIPEAYVDEWSPPGRSSADAWLVRNGDGSWRIGGDDPDFPECHPITLAHGAVMDFWIDECCGEAVVTVADGGDSITCAVAMPQRANCCAIMDGFQIETPSNSLEETLAAFKDAEPENGDYTVAFRYHECRTMLFDASRGTFTDVTESLQ